MRAPLLIGALVRRGSHSHLFFGPHAVVAVVAMLSLAAAALALYDSSKPKEGDVYYATVKNFHSVVLSQPGAVAVQFFALHPR